MTERMDEAASLIGLRGCAQLQRRRRRRRRRRKLLEMRFSPARQRLRDQLQAIAHSSRPRNARATSERIASLLAFAARDSQTKRRRFRTSDRCRGGRECARVVRARVIAVSRFRGGRLSARIDDAATTTAGNRRSREERISG